MRRVLPLLLILAVLAPAAAQEKPDAMSSIFLVAKKDMADPFFRDSVVLVTHRVTAGPIGVIVNRPTGLTVAKALPDAAEAGNARELVYFGGPVAADTLVVVFRATDPPKEATEVMKGVYMTMERPVIRDLLKRNLPPKDIRFFAGYAGWGIGQLEGEVARGGWLLVRADAESLFDKRPENLWQELHRRAAAKVAAR